MTPEIHFFCENIRYRITNKRLLRKWISDVIGRENFRPGNICIVLCDDSYLHTLNVKYLHHDTLTDIITFGYSQTPGIISGDIFISLPRVRENARAYGQPLKTELNRVIIHGILHIAGYNDKTNTEKAEMRKREDLYLELIQQVEGIVPRETGWR